jgi:hypothetical protein
MVDRHYFLDVKPWSARTLYVYAHADLVQKYSVGLQEIFSPGCEALLKSIKLNLTVFKHVNVYNYDSLHSDSRLSMIHSDSFTSYFNIIMNQ